MLIGKVKWFHDAKGYGFIQAEGQDYFVHYSAIQGEGYKKLETDDKVSFSVGVGKKGSVAENVKVID